MSLYVLISKRSSLSKGWRDVARAILFLSLAWLVVACKTDQTKLQSAVIVETSAGSIHIELYPDQAPKTVANFLQYVDAKRYDNASFYRVVRDDNQAQNSILIDVIQGGLGFDVLDSGFPPIAHEGTQTTGLRHQDGTLSLARGEPGTGSSEFFICIGEQTSLDFGGMRNPDGLGFAAFGQVTQGMDIVQRIQTMPTIQETGELAYTSGQMLSDPVRIISVREAD